MLSLCLHLSSLNLYHLISTVDVILWFRFFINSVLAYVHVPHIYCLIISLNWYFVNSGSKRSRCFIHYLNIQYASRYLFVLFYYYYYYFLIELGYVNIGWAYILRWHKWAMFPILPCKQLVILYTVL